MCDPIQGNRLYGEVQWSASEDGDPIVGQVRGASHCAYHYLEKADAWLSPREVGMFVMAYLDGKDADEVNDMMPDLSEGYDVELEARQCR